MDNNIIYTEHKLSLDELQIMEETDYVCHMCNGDHGRNSECMREFTDSSDYFCY